MESVLGVEHLRLMLVLANEFDWFTRCEYLYWSDGYAITNGAAFRRSYHFGREEDHSVRWVATLVCDEGGKAHLI